MSQDPNYKAKKHYQNLAVAQQYDAERFDSWVGRISHQTEARALARAADLYFEPGDSVLDVPCGTARLFPLLLDRGLKVTGGDISDEMIQVATKQFGSRKDVKFSKVDAEKLPFKDHSFDHVTSYRLMCHLPQDARFRILSEMMRVARKFAVINYHFTSVAPLALFNRFFRKHAYVTYPLTESVLRKEISLKGHEVCDIRKLSWYERSSALVIIRKHP